MDHLIENIETLIDTVENLRTSKRLLPCLSLLYTGMDVMDSLERQPGEGTKQSFTHWADTYLAARGESTTERRVGPDMAVPHAEVVGGDGRSR